MLYYLECYIMGWLGEITVTWRTKAPNLARGSLRAYLYYEPESHLVL